MKPINEYCDKVSSINEYLSTKVNVKSPCPLEPCQEDMINFLQANGFEEIKNFDYENADLFDLVKMISFKSEENKKREYLVSNDLYQKEYRWIRFWFGGEINNENPIFFVRVTNNGHFTEKVKGPNCALENATRRFKEIYAYNDFVDFINDFLYKNK